MLDPSALFERRTFAFAGTDDEIEAVRDGRKGLAWYPMTREQIETYSDYDELAASANAAGLSVVVVPRNEADDSASGAAELDVFVLRREESWRANAFLACRRTLASYQWSDSSEYLYSALLGYPEDDCKNWIAECRYNRLGWVGQTVYSPLDSAQVRLLEPLACRCCPSGFDTENMTVIAHPDGWSLRRDLQPSLPSGISLCRFALDNGLFLRLFSDMPAEKGEVLSTTLAIPAQRLNEALMSHIEVWTTEGWRSRY